VLRKQVVKVFGTIEAGLWPGLLPLGIWNGAGERTRTVDPLLGKHRVLGAKVG
jgi:hypothetical protein